MLKILVIQRFATAALLITACNFCIAQDRVVHFLGEEYIAKPPMSSEKSSAQEFIRANETLDSWTRLLTIQCHPSSSRVADVVKPYLASRKDLFLTKPIFLKSPNDGMKGLVIVTTLGNKDAPTFEFVAARFLELSQGGVAAIVFSQKIPAAKEVRIDNGKLIETSVSEFDTSEVAKTCLSSS